MTAKTHFLKMDLKRCFCSKKLLLGVLGCILIMFFGSMEWMKTALSVFYVYDLLMSGMPFLIVLTFCALPYSGGFCDDLENKYIMQLLIRGNIRKYIASKIVTVVVSSISCYLLAASIYIGILHAKLTWLHSEEMQNFDDGNLLVQQGHYLGYLILMSLQFSLVTAVLSLLASYISLYINNRLLTLTVPLMAYYAVMYYGLRLFRGIPWLNIVFVYIPTQYRVGKDDGQSFLWAMFLAGIAILVLSIAIYKKVERRIWGE